MNSETNHYQNTNPLNNFKISFKTFTNKIVQEYLRTFILFELIFLAANKKIYDRCGIHIVERKYIKPLRVTF